MHFEILPILALLLQCAFNEDLLSKFHQKDYSIKDLRAELESFDPEVCRFVKLITYKYNRTTPAINCSFSFLIDVGDTLQILTQAYKFLSNEYRMFPMRFQVKFFSAFKANACGFQDAVKKCGFVNNTYFVKDTLYYVCNQLVDESRLPPFLPSGRFKFELSYIYLNKKIITINAFFEIYRTISPPKQKKH